MRVRHGIMQLRTCFGKVESSIEVKGELDDEAATVREEFQDEAVRTVATSGVCSAR